MDNTLVKEIMNHSVKDLHSMLDEDTDWKDSASSLTQNMIIVGSMSRMISCILIMSCLERDDVRGIEIWNSFVTYYSLFWNEYASMVDPICGIGPLDNLTLEPLENEVLEVKSIPTNTRGELANGNG